jgi:hypothetical protein
VCISSHHILKNYILSIILFLFLCQKINWLHVHGPISDPLIYLSLLLRPHFLGYCKFTLSWESPIRFLTLFETVDLLGLLFVCLFVWYRVWTQGSHLLDRNSTTWATPPALSALVILEIGSHFLTRTSWTSILLFYTFHSSWDDRCTPICPAFFPRYGVLQTFFCLGWLGFMILPISVSCSCDDRCTLLCPAFGWDGIAWTFCPRWILPVSAYQVARVADVSHQSTALLGLTALNINCIMSLAILTT